jgi:RNA polymerase sporulation-specific sigma factor
MGFAGVSIEGRFGWMHDEEVVHLAKSRVPGAAECLIGRYRRLVEVKARTYYVIGADRDDIVQEGLIGLFEAIRDYRDDRRARFRPFAELCVTRQMISAVKASRRQKHELLNDSLSLNLTDPSLVAPDRRDADIFWQLNIYESATEVLSGLEKQVLGSYLDGRTYREMSEALRCHPKVIDNALQRAKRKIGQLLQDCGPVS